MIRRLLGACAGAALVGVLSVSARVAAKPPDLPMNEVNTATPRVAPQIEEPASADPTAPPATPAPVRAHPILSEMRIEVLEGNTGTFGIGVNGNSGLTGRIVVNERNFELKLSKVVKCLMEELLPPAQSLYEILPNAVPTPTLYQLSPTPRRRLVGSMLFSINPILSLVPTEKALDAPHDHPQRVAGDDLFREILPGCEVETDRGLIMGGICIPQMELDLVKLAKSLMTGRRDRPSREQNEGFVKEIDFVVVSSDAEQAEIDAPLVPSVEALPMPQEDKPHKKRNAKAERLPMPREDADGVTCPFLRQQMTDRHVCQMADPQLGRSVLDNLERLKEADGLVELAEEFARRGCVAEAMACCDQAEKLCPGSPCAHRAADVMLAACLGTYTMPSGAEEAAEESAPAKKGIEKPCKKHRNKQSIEKKLHQPVSVNFTNTPLRQVIDDLRAYQCINIYVDEPALAEKGINIDQPITIKLDEISFKSMLNLLLHSAHLTYVIDAEEVLRITTEEHARGKLMTRVYNVVDLVGHKELPKGCRPHPRKANQAPEDGLIELLTSTIAPRSWSEQGGVGTIDYFPLTMSLVVNQTADVQDQINDLLAALRRFYQKQDEEQETSCRKSPGVEQQVRGLMKACRLLVNEGLHEQAAELARQAYALDPESVAADPLVYKMHLIAEEATYPHSTGSSEPSEPPSCPYCPRAGKPIREIVPEKKEDKPTTLLVPPMPPVDYEIVSALERVQNEGAEEASEPAAAPSSIDELIESITGGPGEARFGFGLNSDGSLRLSGDCSCAGSVYHVLFSKGSLAVWKTPDAGKVKP